MNTLDYLRDKFKKESISGSEFCRFLGISPATGTRMRRAGTYPKTLEMGASYPRILLTDLATWLDAGGSKGV